MTQGVITYDGIDVRRIRKDDLRHSLGVVLQDSHLLDVYKRQPFSWPIC